MLKNLYGEQDEPTRNEPTNPSDDTTPNIWRECDYGCNVSDSVVYLSGDIDEQSGHEFIVRSRTVLLNRPEQDSKKPLTVLLDSGGGDAYSMFSIIDFIESLPVKVNIIARGRAMSAAAMILASTTGTRSASKRCSIMVHEGFTMQQGKSSDMRAASAHIENIEKMCNSLLGEKTKKSAEWWSDNTRTDMYLTSTEALDLGLIDEIL